MSYVKDNGCITANYYELLLKLMRLRSLVMRVVMGLSSQYWVLLVMNVFLSNGPIRGTWKCERLFLCNFAQFYHKSVCA